VEISTRYQETLEHIQEIFALAEAVKEYQEANRLHSQKLVTDRVLEIQQLAETCLAVDGTADREAMDVLQSGIQHLQREHKRAKLLAPLTKVNAGIQRASQGVLEAMTLGLWRE
jgi:hypothetical protein